MKNPAIFPWFDNTIKALQDKNLSHAYLISGNEGLGKIDFCNLFAQSLLCSNRDNFFPCEKCKSCKLFISHNHPDLYLISKEEDKTFISINQIRDIQSSVFETAFMGGSKVFLINRCELMNSEASNSMLKILEEPPKNTFFILTSNSSKSISLTVRSRCIEMQIPNPSDAQIINWLDQTDLNRDESLKILSLNRKNISTLIKQDNSQILEDRQSFINEIGLFIKQGHNLLEVSSSWSKEPTSLTLHLDWMSRLLMDALRFKTGSSLIQVQEDSKIISKYLAQKVTHQVLCSLLFSTNSLWNLFKNGTSLKPDYHLRSLLIDWGQKLNISTQ
ncbi:MAG: DNA polymerase III subunit delta' [SAR86 cluster bacterium]|jgi:DNA polymerase III subunit delta'|nr:DNA polymerase III subunit delta' [SAR86 cluster bacterium]